MKILYVVHASPYDEFSGAPLIAKQYALKSLERGCEVCIITPTFENIDFRRQTPKNINNIFFLKWPAIKNWSLDAFVSDSLNKKELFGIPFSPDLIHILDWVSFCPSVLNALKQFNKPIIKHILNFEDFCYFISPIYYNNSGEHCVAPLTAEQCANCIGQNIFKNSKFLKKIKFFFTKENLKNFNLSKKKLLGRNELIRIQTKKFYDHLVFPSKTFAQYYFTHLEHKKNYSIIPFGINVKKKNLIKKNNYPLKFIYTGGSSTRKGWTIIENTFEKILKNFPNKICLRIYGHKKKIKKSKLNKYSEVEFFDNFNPDDLEKTFSWADFGVAPTFFESYCRIVREYINCGVVPISTNAFGIPDIITNYKNGILINKPFSENLILTIEKIINQPEILFNLQKGLKNTKIISEDDEYNQIYKLYKNYVL